MKLQKTIAVSLLAVALAGMSRMATAQLTLDDFSTGQYQKMLKYGRDTNFQTGKMVGGLRETDFCVSKPCSGQTNPFGQTGSFQISPATNTSPSALIYSTGYKVLPRLVLIYGQGGPLNLALAPAYDRLRLSFDGNNSVTNFLIYAWSGSTNVSTLACHIAFNPYPFTVDLPFADFKLDGGTGVDFTNVSAMSLVFTQDYTVGGTDWAITSFEAIPTGAPPGNVICNNH